MGFPPRILHRSVVVWTTLKLRYTACVIVLLEDSVYYSIGSDALVLHVIANLPLVRANLLYTYFTIPVLEQVLLLCLRADLRVVIAQPMGDPGSELFM